MYFNFSSGYPAMQFFLSEMSCHGSRRNNTRRDNLTAYYDMFINLCDLFLNMFEWKGLPETCNERMLETSLLFNGNCLFFQHHDNDGFFHCPFSYDASQLDFYNQPTSYLTMSPTYNGQRYTNEEAVVIRDTPMQYPLWIALEFYARRISDNQRSIDVVQHTMKRPFVVSGTKDTEVSIREIFNQQETNEIIMVLNKNVLKGGEFKLFNIPENANNMYALWDNLNNLYQEVYKRIGIKCSGKDKAERLVVTEAKGQFESIDSNLNMLLDSRKKACEEINNLFGLSVSVDLRHDYNNEMEVEKEDGNTEGDE